MKQHHEIVAGALPDGWYLDPETGAFGTACVEAETMDFTIESVYEDVNGTTLTRRSRFTTGPDMLEASARGLVPLRLEAVETYIRAMSTRSAPAAPEA